MQRGSRGIRVAVWCMLFFFFFSSRRRHTRFDCDWSSDVCSSDLNGRVAIFSRTLDEISVRFPELREPLAALPTDLIIDGEIIAARSEEILPFSDLDRKSVV